MQQFEALLNIDPTAQTFADAIMVAIHEAAAVVQREGKALTLNALMGAICTVAAYHVAGVDDARARKALMRQIEKDLPGLVARMRANQTRGSVETIYQGGKVN